MYLFIYLVREDIIASGSILLTGFHFITISRVGKKAQLC